MSRTIDATKARALAATIRARIGTRKWYSNDGLLGHVDLVAGYGDLPFEVATATYGIIYALQTGRASTPAYHAIKAMTSIQLFKLIAGAAVACPTVGDVPRWLNAQY